MKIGVFALQGDFREHIAAVNQCGYQAIPILRATELDEIDALILPGGESTTIMHLAKTLSLIEPIKVKIATGLPVYGSCAGMILLANRILGGAEGQETFGGLDITVRRNAFGRQVDSFESEIDFAGLPISAVFIRAPWVEELGAQVKILSEIDSHAVAVSQGRLLATSFHPELTANLAVHRYFFDEICQGR